MLHEDQSWWARIRKHLVRGHQTSLRFSSIMYIYTNELIDIDEISIQWVMHTKYIWVGIDDKSNWHEHVNYVCSSLMKCCGIFSKAKYVKNKNSARDVYFAFIYTSINVGIGVQGNVLIHACLRFKLCKINWERMLIEFHYREEVNMYKVNILSFVNTCFPLDVAPVLLIILNIRTLTMIFLLKDYWNPD